MRIEDIVERFNTTPFLFVGSGITRRYLGLPDWDGLLEIFAKIVNDDEYSYRSYVNKAKNGECKAGLMPKIAELIEKDFNEKWFSDCEIRTGDAIGLQQVKDGISPFKVELALYIKNQSQQNDSYLEEMELLSRISEKNIAGVITTNYDTFLEEHFKGYTNYIGQNQLVFSAIQGIAEIYKIHGSIEKPDTIVINEHDYVKFEKYSAYLAAKLMTIFMEYPIIFMGYSISDTNIQNIIKSIVVCLDDEQLHKLEDRFIFIEYSKGMVGIEVSTYTIMVEGRPLHMKKIKLDDYKQLYYALQGKKSKLPMKILRRFKEEIYEYSVTSVPTSKLRVAEIEDERIEDEELVIDIVKRADIGLKGLSGINGNEWYRDIVLGDIGFSDDDLLKYALPKLLQENSGKLPVNKYLKNSNENHQSAQELAKKQKFDKIISDSIKKRRGCLGTYTSVQQIWQQEKQSMERATRLISHLTEEQMNVEELREVLLEIFAENINVLEDASAQSRTNIRRLIRIYDYLKWGK